MGYRIKELRESKRMSQDELAKAADVSRTTISNLETDMERSASTKTLMKIANALDTTIDQLFFAESV